MRVRTAAVRLGLAVTLAAFGVAIISIPAGADGTTVTSYSYASQAGDWVGQGASNSYTPTTANIRVTGTAGSLRFMVGTATESWEVDLAAPSGTQLRTGTYSQAARAPFNGSQPGLAVFGDGRGCNTDAGSFVINSIGADTSGTVTELDATFTQWCDASTGSLSGRVAYQAPPAAAVVLTSSNPSTVLGQPVALTAQVPVGSSGTVAFRDGATALGSATIDATGLAALIVADLAAGSHTITATFGATSSTPVTQTVRTNTTSYWFASPAGDWIGAGATASYALPDSTITVSGSTSALTATVTSGADRWSVTLAAPAGQALVPGTYSGAERAAFRSAGAPGLDVAGNGRGCNNVAGSFTIDRIGGNASAVTLLDASFSQNCEGAPAPALRGWIKFRAPAPSTTVLTAPATVNAGQPATLTAAVSGSNGPLSGSVTFSDGATVLGTVAVDATGHAALTSALAVGPHTLTASYSGSVDYLASAGTANVSVARYVTTAVLSASATSVKHGKPVTLTVRLSGGPTPSGNVTLYRDGQPAGTTTAINGVATFTVTSQLKATDAFTAVYAGDAAHQTATSNAVTIRFS